ncbi:TOBE domain-containing protein [uncultured Methanobrevibacter sp.]|uniref:TOBE domain-containing protein n=1 Tax=uncultured Methanobrevibacter sp. TaxID=253161 RepID=UPI0034417A04
MKRKITEIKTDEFIASVKIHVEELSEITTLITKKSVEELGLKKGDYSLAIIKSTELL